MWLDTTVLLTLIVEQLEEDQTLRRLTGVVLACHDAGIEVRVTPGMIIEITSHMNRSLACSRVHPSSWRGRVPYLYERYLRTGKPSQEFAKWLWLFRGEGRPEEDVAQFLYDMFAIQQAALSEEAQKVSEELRWAAERLWSEAHRERRQPNIEEYDESTTQQLIEHDLETYLGVITPPPARTGNRTRVWALSFLTFDSIAWQIRDRLREEFKSRTPPSPLLSLDFLVNNLTFGPERGHLARMQSKRCQSY